MRWPQAGEIGPGRWGGFGARSRRGGLRPPHAQAEPLAGRAGGPQASGL